MHIGYMRPMASTPTGFWFGGHRVENQQDALTTSITSGSTD